ncbi:MAG: hypothetical protein ACODAJ_14210 [Planctomycetota bacterium]
MERSILCISLLALLAACGYADPPHPVMQWVKRHPRPDAAVPSPRMGYETSYGYDWLRRRLIRYGGHNQGGGGEQNSEVWIYDLANDVWDLMEPNDAPPGVCCAQQNVFHDALRKFIRFPAFSGSHGWQSFREIYLKNSSVWTYDLDTNTWRAMRPCPEVWPRPLRGAAYDPHHQVVVLHGGEGGRHGTVVYDLHANAWHRMDPPEPKPQPNLSQPGFTYDAVNRVFVLFGSQFQTDERTWLYDLRKSRWRVLDVNQHPPGAKTSPVLAADTRNGVVLCSVQRGEKDRTLETWALDVAKKTWTRLDIEPPPASGNRNRVLTYVPDQNLFVLENRTREPKEQQIWTFRYAKAPPPVRRLRGLQVATEADRVTLTWEIRDATTIARFDVYRGEGTRPWEVDLRPVAEGVRGVEYVDRGVKQGVLYHYQVRGKTLNAAGAESFVVRAQPRVVTDLVVSAVAPKRVELTWPKAEARDVVGYHVERADVAAYSTDEVTRLRIVPGNDLAVGRIKAIGPFQRLTLQPVEEPGFVDETVDLRGGQKSIADPIGGSPLREKDVDAAGKPYRFAVYAYCVRAVNRLGVESGPSPFAFTYPSAVEHVFAKEEPGGTCRLKWRANAEKGLRGYHVYRHQGRWNKQPIERLTPEPIAATTFLDEAAGEPTRRYEIAAVDALGQVGEPSRPVWYLREWRKYYVPYVEDWHQ